MPNKIYVEMIKQNGAVEHQEVAKRNPSDFANDKDIIAFRYYIYDDFKHIEYDDECFYNGKRLTKEQAATELDNVVDVVDYTNKIGYYFIRSYLYKEKFFDKLYQNPYGSLCLTQSGDITVMQNKTDITIEEYQVKYKQNLYELKLEKVKKEFQENRIKYVMMQNGIYLVRPERIVDWFAYVDENSKNLTIIDIVRYCMMEIENDTPNEKIVESCLNITSPKILKEVIAPAVAYFNLKGINFKEYVDNNLQLQINSNEKDIDPSLTFVLTRTKKEDYN